MLYHKYKTLRQGTKLSLTSERKNYPNNQKIMGESWPEFAKLLSGRMRTDPSWLQFSVFLAHSFMCLPIIGSASLSPLSLDLNPLCRVYSNLSKLKPTPETPRIMWTIKVWARKDRIIDEHDKKKDEKKLKGRGKSVWNHLWYTHIHRRHHQPPTDFPVMREFNEIPSSICTYMYTTWCGWSRENVIHF